MRITSSGATLIGEAMLLFYHGTLIVVSGLDLAGKQRNGRIDKRAVENHLNQYKLDLATTYSDEGLLELAQLLLNVAMVRGSHWEGV